MRLTVDLPWFTYPRRLAIMVIATLLLLAIALPASAAPPQGVSGEVTVVNDETNPVPVTGEVTVGNTDPVPVENAARADIESIHVSLPLNAHHTASTFNTISAVTVTIIGEVQVWIEGVDDTDALDAFLFDVTDDTFSQVFPVPIRDVTAIDITCFSDSGCVGRVAVAGWDE